MVLNPWDDNKNHGYIILSMDVSFLLVPSLLLREDNEKNEPCD